MASIITKKDKITDLYLQIMCTAHKVQDNTLATMITEKLDQMVPQQPAANTQDSNIIKFPIPFARSLPHAPEPKLTASMGVPVLVFAIFIAWALLPIIFPI